MTRAPSSEVDTLLADPVLRELIEMHMYRRPSGSQTEAEFNKKWIDCLPGVRIDDVGNRIGKIGSDPVTLWSSHTDTVHRMDGMQALAIGDNWLTVGTAKPGQPVSNCLGADCTVGVWIMRQMYLNKVPGLYIWHHGEEVGGIGSRYIADKTPEILSGINAAVAFDRRGATSVITHQFGERTASDVFAKSLVAELNVNWDGLDWELDDSGVFTDTANYSSIIPECTNISVGYTSEHTNKEALNILHAYDLLERMLEIDEERFMIARDPTVVEYGDWGKNYRWYGGNPNPYGSHGDPYEDAMDNYKSDEYTITNLVRSHPKAVAEMLVACGFTYEEVRKCVLEYSTTAYGRPY